MMRLPGTRHFRKKRNETKRKLTPMIRKGRFMCVLWDCVCVCGGCFMYDRRREKGQARSQRKTVESDTLSLYPNAA